MGSASGSEDACWDSSWASAEEEEQEESEEEDEEDDDWWLDDLTPLLRTGRETVRYRAFTQNQSYRRGATVSSRSTRVVPVYIPVSEISPILPNRQYRHRKNSSIGEYASLCADPIPSHDCFITQAENITNTMVLRCIL